MIKKNLSESNIKTRLVTPAILKSGWDVQTQLGLEIFCTADRIYEKEKLGTTIEFIKASSTKHVFIKAIKELEVQLYNATT